MTAEMNRIREEFRDPEYRHGYIQSFVDSVVASQVRILRKHHGLSQAELAEKLGTKQSAISRIEDPNSSVCSVTTLKRLAKVFDVGLSVRFESFGEMLFEIEDRSPDTLWQPSFDKDPAFQSRPAFVTHSDPEPSQGREFLKPLSNALAEDWREQVLPVEGKGLDLPLATSRQPLSDACASPDTIRIASATSTSPHVRDGATA